MRGEKGRPERVERGVARGEERKGDQRVTGEERKGRREVKRREREGCVS